ncbi:MAG: helix-turn-helix domain-containing protein [Eubacteriales bacterium]|nr:helix-turn-helix domain-containing protein [Eubacteriales bacterium]
MERSTGCRNMSAWRSIISVTIENMVVQLYPCGFSASMQQHPGYHTHLYHEVFFVQTGSIEIRTTEKMRRFHPEDCLIIPAGLPHARKEYETDSPPMTLDLRFTIQTKPNCDGTEADIYSGFANLLEPAEDIILLPHSGRVARLFAQITEEKASALPFQELKIKAEATLLFAAFYRLLIEGAGSAVELSEMPDEPEPNEPVSMHAYIDFMFNRRFANPELKLEELADLLHLSPRQTERLVIQLYGKSFKCKMMETRLQNARILLRTTEAPIADIARFCGYSSHSGLIKAFSAEFGETPAEYRQAVHSEPPDESEPTA